MGIVYIAVQTQNNYIVGFVSGVTNTKKFYISFLLQKGLIAMPFLLNKIFNLQFIKKFIESLTVPFKKKTIDNIASDSDSLPELISIAVLSETKGQGVGGLLVSKLEEHFADIGIKKYSVVVGEKLEMANNFYQKLGFLKNHQITVHGQDRSNVYVKKVQQDTDT